MTATYRLFAKPDQDIYIDWEHAEQPSHKVFEKAGGVYLLCGSGLVAAGMYVAIGTALTVTGLLLISAGVAVIGMVSIWVCKRCKPMKNGRLR